MGRKRLPVGKRKIDQYETVIIKLPNSVFEIIAKKGKPSDIIQQLVLKEYPLKE